MRWPDSSASARPPPSREVFATIQIRELAFGSAEQVDSIALRLQLLRAPLGLTFERDELDAERSEIHIGAFDGHDLIGCLLLAPISREGVKMRQVVVEEGRRGAGIGQAMVAFCERLAADRGFKTMTLHARESAVPFYLGLGYKIVGEPFVEVTIPHRAMEKRLAGQY